MSFFPECVAPTSCMMGASPVWSPTEDFLWWVDSSRAKLHRFNPKTGNTRRYDLPIRASALALHPGGFVMVGGREGGLYDPATEAYEKRFELDGEIGPGQISDVGVAPDGALWLGLMDGARMSPLGRCCRVDEAWRVEALSLPPVIVMRTLCFSPDGRTFYTCDTEEQEILAHDFDPSSRKFSDRRLFATSGETGGYPMGSAVDSEGYVWNAQWDSGCVVRYRPEGVAERIVELPVSRPTGCVFGGKDLDTLYITTSRAGLPIDELERQPFAGGLFALRVSTPGAPCRVVGAL